MNEELQKLIDDDTFNWVDPIPKEESTQYIYKFIDGKIIKEHHKVIKFGKGINVRYYEVV